MMHTSQRKCPEAFPRAAKRLKVEKALTRIGRRRTAREDAGRQTSVLPS